MQLRFLGAARGVTGSCYELRVGGRASSPANVIAAQSTDDSRRINAVEKGAIVIAGSGMCSGGRILSAHADQAGLLAWYDGFANRPPVCLVHGEPGAQQAFATALRATRRAEVSIPARGEVIPLVAERA